VPTVSRDTLRQRTSPDAGVKILEAAGLELSEQDRPAERSLVMPGGELHHLFSHPPPTANPQMQRPTIPGYGNPQAVVKSGNSQQGRPRHPPLAPRGWVRRAGQSIIFDFCSPSYLQASIMASLAEDPQQFALAILRVPCCSAAAAFWPLQRRSYGSCVGGVVRMPFNLDSAAPFPIPFGEFSGFVMLSAV